ncbi:hypothetical protein [Metabacillus arenae]|uniref:Uncharacterized protein n=1 Tax=Metabacillus arenae TaxID=2771434 RepID=A0A926RZN9_9BACI|nr:hypothetical protein [Metabacillus arenae]MBD1383015.1 hypothetical protein [Metabacillus arenae]
MGKKLYRIIRGVLKHIYNILQKAVPKKYFLSLSFMAMYIANSITVNFFQKRYGFNKINSFPVKDEKEDVLFILGSGSSVNLYTERQWELISNHHSVGFNFWLIHEFIPSFYVYEENLNKDRNQIFYNLLNMKKHHFQNVPIIVKDVEYKGLSVDQIPSELKKDVYLSTELTVGCDEENLKDFFIQGHRFMGNINKNGLNAILKKSGTLSYLIFLAEQLKYKKIVLCGIDLNDSKYFYDLDKYKEEYDIPTNYKDVEGKHPTNQKTNGNVPMEDIIYSINENILKPQGIKLYVGSKTSALFPKLPYYFEGI